jgi:hypothetical protein
MNIFGSPEPILPCSGRVHSDVCEEAGAVHSTFDERLQLRLFREGFELLLLEEKH